MKLRLFVLAMILATPAAWGANLGAVIQWARESDAQFAAAREAFKAGQEKLPQARAGLLPTVSLGGNLRYNSVDASVGGNANYRSNAIALSLAYPLYRKQNLESYEQGKLLVLQAEQQLRLAEQDLLLRVARAYFDVLTAQDALTTARSQKIAFAEQLAQARKSFEVGTATITDTHEAQARFDLTVAQELAADNDLEVRRRALERLIGRTAPALATMADKARMPLPEPNNMDAWVQQAENASVAVQLAQSALEVSRREVERQRGGELPTVDLAASLSNSSHASSVSGTTRSGVIGVEFAWPLYQGGLVDSRIREAVANQEKSRYDLDNVRRQAALDTRQGFLGVVSGEARSRALDQALVSSEAQLKSTKLGLEVGVRTRVDVLNAQQQLFTTQRDLAAARYQTLIAGLQLKAAAGALVESDLKAIDALLRD